MVVAALFQEQPALAVSLEGPYSARRGTDLSDYRHGGHSARRSGVRRCARRYIGQAVTVQVVAKHEALARLAVHRERLLKDGAGCVMCQLARGAGELPFIAENEHAVVLLDELACRAGHLMIIPKRHVERLSDLPWQVFMDVQRLVYEAPRAIDACLNPARIFTATLGAAVELPMTYAHHHVHVIPVYETDERARPARVLSWTEGVLVYDDDEAAALSRKLTEHWPRSPS